MQYLNIPTEQIIEGVRSASRHLVREFGFLEQTIAGSNLSASAVYALIEIGKNNATNSSDLVHKLLLEKSTVSRLVKNLVARGYLSFKTNPVDTRAKDLCLTKEGFYQLQQINQYARRQVITALSPLNSIQQKTILEGFEQYASLLTKVRIGPAKLENNNDIINTNRLTNEIVSGYTPSILGDVVSMHANFYSQLVNFGSVFEASVASGMAEFLPRLENKKNEIWYVKDKKRVIASISIDGQIGTTNSATLRWFIIDPLYSGKGLGRKLMAKAMLHCQNQGFNQIELWTFAGLDAAWYLYESYGFKLIEEQMGNQWGENVLEQKFIKSAVQDSKEY